ncbi:Electron transfer flavoprotein-ubiquinone oxidoreductase, mitochondrial [Galdieria sulphuraria]|nr:Electron transfer flavoprotein-ubiquinone oxidoreductase, mitochondrial [Galdieria sulphuraria]
MLEGGEVIQYGARSLNEGGFQSIPKLAFPGGALIGCSAGFLNVPKIKGTHTAMKSGMLAAESAFEYLNGSKQYSEGEVELENYERALRNSWVYDELSRERNIRPGFRWGLIGGLTNAAIETYIFHGKSFWTLHLPHEANESLKPASSSKKIVYPKPDGKLTFDILTSVALSGTNHDHDQPPHLKVKDSKVAEEVNWKLYAGPESRYCPARVYEYVEDDSGQPKLQINAQNCLHCKACDIKDPKQNIQWTVPEGGGGPKYTVM